MTYRLLYSKTARDQIRSLHPLHKPSLKARIVELTESPFKGKALEKDLAGYFSLRSGRYRTIYRVNHKRRIVEIHFVGHRKDIYERFQDLLTKEA